MFRWKQAASLAILAWGLGAAPADAGWQSAFQVTCFRRPVVAQAPPDIAMYAPPDIAMYAPADACCAPPPPVRTTQYVQRSYYQPVTEMRQQSYYEPVTTYRTSYYYEPVTTYRYSCAFDPSSCSYRMVQTPVTSYRLKSQCCPVQSFVQRTAMVPVQTYRIATYYEPVTSCCTPTPSCPQGGAAPAPAPATNPPAVSESQSSPPAGVQEFRGNGTANPPSSPLYDRSAPPAGASPPANGTRRVGPQYPQTPTPPVAPRYDRITQDTDRTFRPITAKLSRIVEDENVQQVSKK